MHILLLAPLPLNLTEITSGVPKVSAVLLKSLRAVYNEKLKISVLSFITEIDKPRIIEEETIGTIHYVPMPKNNLLFLYIPTILKIRKYIKHIHPDIVHSQGFAELILGGEFSGFKHVTTLHGLIQNEYKTETNIKYYIRGMLRAYMEKFYFKRLRFVISISDYISTHIKSKRINIERIDNPIDVNFFNINGEGAKEKGLIVQVGSFVHRKGAHILAEAIIKGNFKNFKVCFVGNMKDKKYLNTVKQIIETNKEFEHVFEFHDSVTDEVLYRFYSRASIVMLPSLEETAPLSLAQAMACGSFIMASNCAGIPSLIKNDSNGILFEKNNPEAIVQALINYQNNEYDVSRITRNAKDDALEKFHPESVAQHTYNFYNKIIKM